MNDVIVGIAMDLFIAAIFLAASYSALAPHFAFWLCFIGCGLLANASHKYRSYKMFKTMTSLTPAPKPVICLNCGHTPNQHEARKQRQWKPDHGLVKLEWICYGSDGEGIACPCPGFTPEVLKVPARA